MYVTWNLFTFIPTYCFNPDEKIQMEKQSTKQRDLGHISLTMDSVSHCACYRYRQQWIKYPAYSHRPSKSFVYVCYVYKRQENFLNVFISRNRDCYIQGYSQWWFSKVWTLSNYGQKKYWKFSSFSTKNSLKNL